MSEEQDIIRIIKEGIAAKTTNLWDEFDATEPENFSGGPNFYIHRDEDNSFRLIAESEDDEDE